MINTVLSKSQFLKHYLIFRRITADGISTLNIALTTHSDGRRKIQKIIFGYSCLTSAASTLPTKAPQLSHYLLTLMLQQTPVDESARSTI